MQPQEITVQEAADFVVKYMKNEEHISRLVTSQSKDEKGQEAIYGQILTAAVERVKPTTTKR